jgi:hypothetical protein
MRANPAAARAWQLKFDRQIGAFRSIWQAGKHRPALMKLQSRTGFNLTIKGYCRALYSRGECFPRLNTNQSVPKFEQRLA